MEVCDEYFAGFVSVKYLHVRFRFLSLVVVFGSFDTEK